SLNSRLPMAEDSQAWRVLLDDYHLVAVEHGVLLLARDGASRPPRVPARRVVERRVALGEWVDVPDDPDWHELALDVDYSVIGRVKCALHRPARLLLEVRLRKGRG